MAIPVNKITCRYNIKGIVENKNMKTSRAGRFNIYLSYIVIFLIASFALLSGCSNGGAKNNKSVAPATSPVALKQNGNKNNISSLTFKVGTEPTAIAIDGLGNIWVVDSGSEDITKLSPKGALIGTYAAPYISGFKSLNSTIAIDASGNAWVIDNGSLVEISQTGAATIYGKSVEKPIVAGPGGIAIDSLGNIWVNGVSSIMKVNSKGVPLTGILGYKAGMNVSKLAVDSSGDVLAVNTAVNTVTKLSSDGFIIGKYKVSLSAAFLTPSSGIALDKSGNIWLGGGFKNAVTELSRAGAVIGTYSAGDGPNAIAIDDSGNVWIANDAGDNVTELNPSGKPIGTYPVGHGPDAIAIDASGNVWVADGGLDDVTELIGAAKGPQYFPYKGPQWP